MNQNEEWLKEFLENDNEIDSELAERARSLQDILQEVQDIYEESDDIVNRLAVDEELQHDFMEKLGIINMIELSGEKDKEIIENAYLSLLDTIFELAKIDNCLAGFGRDRLVAGMHLIRFFEEHYHQVSTIVTPDNVGAFRTLLDEENYEDVRTGRKKAIGALRREGEDLYAAGIVVYESEPSPLSESSHIMRLYYLYVEEDFRRRGVGNFLLAHVLYMAAASEDAFVSYSAVCPTSFSIKEESESELFEDFLASWHFTFRYHPGEVLHIIPASLEKNKMINAAPRNVVSLGKMPEAAYKVKKYFTEKNDPFYAKLIRTPVDFYDKKASCAILKEGKIYALLLIHRYKNGNYRVEYLTPAYELKDPNLVNLLRHAYHAITADGGARSVIRCQVSCEEGMMFAQQVLPEAQTMLTLQAQLASPLSFEALDMELWKELREEAGYSSFTIPEGDLTEEDFTNEALKGLRELILGSSYDAAAEA